MNDIALYVHIPFCKEKCRYCDFLSFKDTSKSLDYKNALLREIDAFDTNKNVKSIFIGGGTPSFVEPKFIAEIMEHLSKFKINSDAEITIESNPGTLTAKKLEIYKKSGINRISIGLQAWQNRILKTLGRIHSREEFLESYSLARKFGFDNINIDIMFSLPGQSFDDWKTTLENVTRLEPEHISAYSLIVEKNTPFYNMELELPDEKIDREMYHYAIEYLSQNGYKQYEISNFAKLGKNSVHNTAYWIRSDYKGFGLGAASLLNDVRYKNTDSMTDYINGKTICEKENLTPNDIIEEFMFLGFRMNRGVSISEFSEKFKRDIFEVYGDVLKKYSDYIVIENGRIHLNTLGFDISNTIMCDFLF